MSTLKSTIAMLQAFYGLAIAALFGLFRRPCYLRDIIEQMDYAGSGSLFIVFLVSLFIGMALSLQISAALSVMGFKVYTGRIVGLSIITEIGPVAVAISFAGRAGSGIASELGSMVLGHQVDTLRVFGIDPVKKLVVPRVISSVLMLPVLTMVGDAVAILGAFYVSVYLTHQSSSFFWQQVKLMMDYQTVVTGVVKPFIFGYLIATISCFMGLSTHAGAKGLRKTTTAAVVLSIVMVIVTDFVLTRILFFIFGTPL